MTQILVNMPEEVFQVVAKHVGDHTWEQSVFSDESLSNKKMYPGHVFKHSKPGWQDLKARTFGRAFCVVGWPVAERMES